MVEDVEVLYGITVAICKGLVYTLLHPNNKIECIGMYENS